MNSNKKEIILSFCIGIIATILTAQVLSFVGIIGIFPYSKYKVYKKAIQLTDEINNDFYKKPNKTNLEDGLYKGLFAGLGDVYSSYYTKDEMKQLMELSSGKYVGIGLMVGADKKTGYIKVEQIFDNSPAKKAGVQRGDYIVKVNGKSYTYQDMDIAVKNMKGQPNTSVEVSFSHDGNIYTKKIVRKEITTVSVESKMLENNIGYINIKSFDEDTAKDFRKAISSLEKKNMKALIIDVRDDGGGLLNIVQDIADRILEKATIVYTQNNKGEKEYLKSTDDEKINLPIVVLTNGNSASASEILTGAILDNKAGISIGTTTYGKGLVQEVIQLRDGTGYKLTTAQYFTPNGSYINEKGIKPTIEEKDVNKQLPKAIEYLKEKIK